MTVDETTAQIRRDARSADELHEESRRLLVGSVRAGAAAGLSQRQISDAIGRSQPEVSRLLRFHGQSELGRTLERNRTAILKVLSAGGARNVRVFGSVSRGDDKPGSDIDLLADFTKPASLFALARLEAAVSEILGVHADIVPSDGLRSNLAEKVLAEAVPL
jgi:predicted nucleotidyltransferase